VTDAEVLGQGDERPPRRFGSLLAGAAAVAVLAIGVAGALRSPARPAAGPSPTPSPSVSSFDAGWTEYPPGDPPTAEPDGDDFEEFVSAHDPGDGSVTPLLLPDNTPVLLVSDGGTPVAYEAIGGPEHARVLLGWCPDTTLWDRPGGDYGYLGGLPTVAGLGPLRTYPVRDSTPRGHVDIGLVPGTTQPGGGVVGLENRCEGKRLSYPPLPPRATSFQETATGYRLMTGTYVVTTETRAFCLGSRPDGCQATGWEEYGPHSVLPPGDLASSYTWQGDFLVHADPNSGALTAVRTPRTSLVRREHVGVEVRAGWAAAYEERGGVLHLRFNPFATATTPDDSPPNVPPRDSGRWPGYEDVSGGVVDYALTRDAEVYLGVGYTGLGKPRGTPATLREYLRSRGPYGGPPLWLVLDARGRVIRVVAERDPG
jgi:hypothetical protein